MNESLLVVSKTKAALKAKGVNVGAGALDALNALVQHHVAQAAKRAAANGRKTVRAHNFIIAEAEVEAEVERLPEPSAPAYSQEDAIETPPVGDDQMQAAVADVDQAVEEAAPDVDQGVEEAAEEDPPEAWRG